MLGDLTSWAAVRRPESKTCLPERTAGGVYVFGGILAGNGCICGAAFAWETKCPSAIVGCALLGDEAGEEVW